MRNLFVCHTQAQLILACGLALGRFKNDENVLFLFVDFAIKDELKGKLDKVYAQTVYLQSIYPAEYNTFKSKMKWYWEDLKVIRPYMRKPFDKVIESIDTVYLEQMIQKYARQANPDCELIWLEDGIIPYFQNANIRGGLDANVMLRTFRKILFKYIFQAGKYYNRDFDEFGGSKTFNKMYNLYPDAVREPYKSQREAVCITDEEYHHGLNAMYDTVTLALPDKIIVLVMDKLDTYSYPEKVQDSLKSLLESAKDNGYTVYLKLHPREGELWPCIAGCPAFDKSIGVESLYLSLMTRRDRTLVVGVKSAGLMSAAKLGYKTYSLFSQCGESNADLQNFFNSIGIQNI